jgi:hypothetical protein
MNKKEEKQYECIWNGNGDGNVIDNVIGAFREIHTLDSLLNKYQDIKNDYNEDNECCWTGLTWKEIFSNLDNFEPHLEDNMYIKRIK